jgi:hypothetical protein
MAQLKAILICLLISVMLLSSRCRKKCEPVTPEKILIPQEILDYVDFKKGTYWIFKDSITGDIDSSIVISSEHIFEDVKTLNDCDDLVLSKQFENVIIIADKFDTTGKLIVQFEMSFSNGPKMHGNAPIDEFIIDNYDNFKIAYPFNKTYNTDVQTINEFKVDSIVINGITFKQILDVKREVVGHPNEYDVYSWAKNIGLVQYASFVNNKQTRHSYIIKYDIK